jgi:hypothetical protein
MAHNGQIFIKFYIWEFFENVPKIKVSLKSDKINGYLTWRPMYINVICRWILLRMKNVSEKSCIESQNTCFVLGIDPSQSSPQDVSFTPPNVTFHRNPLHSFSDETWRQTGGHDPLSLCTLCNEGKALTLRQKADVLKQKLAVCTLRTLCLFSWCEGSKRHARLADLLCTGIRTTQTNNSALTPINQTGEETKTGTTLRNSDPGICNVAELVKVTIIKITCNSYMEVIKTMDIKKAGSTKTEFLCLRIGISFGLCTHDDAEVHQFSKILGARTLTKSKSHTEDPQVLGATVQRLVAQATGICGSLRKWNVVNFGPFCVSSLLLFSHSGIRCYRSMEVWGSSFPGFYSFFPFFLIFCRISEHRRK